MMCSAIQELDNTEEPKRSAVAMCVNGHRCVIKSQGPPPKRLTYFWGMILVLFVFFASSNYDAKAQELVILYQVTGTFCAEVAQLKAVAEKINEGVPEQFAVAAGGGEYQCVFHFGGSYRSVANPTIIGRMIVKGKPMLLCTADLVAVVLGVASHRMSKEGEADLPTYFLQEASSDAICLESV